MILTRPILRMPACSASRSSTSTTIAVGLRARHFSNTRLAAMVSQSSSSASPSSPPSSSSSSPPLKSFLVTPAELAQALEFAPPTASLSTSTHRVIPLCAAWFLPNDPEKRTGQSVFDQSRIPHARFFDLDKVKDAESSYPHMLPTAEDFAAAMSDLGVARTDTVVVYDSAELGIFSAPRVAWTLRVFGHDRVHVLNNYRLWKQQGFPTETGPVKEADTTMTWEKTKYKTPSFRSEKVITYREVKEISRRKRDGEKEEVQVLDLRSPGRFDGTAPEPRPGLSSGHMPGSINLPLPQLLDKETGAFLPADRLKEVFLAAGIDPKKPIVSTCGTGVMAAACDLALKAAGFGQPDDRRVYDGSWTEYAQRVDPKDGLIVKGKDA